MAILAVTAAVLGSATPTEASRGHSIQGLMITPAVGAFGFIPVGTCNLVTYTGCNVKTFTLTNVGSTTIYIGGYGVSDPEPFNVALFPGVPGTECSSLPLVDGYWALEPGATCKISVVFTTGAPGFAEAELHVWHTDQFSPIAVVSLWAVGY